MRTGLIVNGAAGKMGRRIIALAVESGEFDLAGAVEAAGHPDSGKDAGALAGVEAIGVKVENDFAGQADVMIDFSLPEATDRSVRYCEENGIALVIGTTGLGDEQMGMLKKAAANIAIVQATNMSVGMNVLFGLVGKVAAALGQGYDVEITEAHHRQKKDCPSGTALTLAEKIAAEIGLDWPGCLVHGRSGKDSARQKGEIGMHAIRAGDIVGEHSVIFGGEGETVTISHSAQSRDVFAHGALRAAKWVSGQSAGLYSMADVLGLK